MTTPIDSEPPATRTPALRSRRRLPAAAAALAAGLAAAIGAATPASEPAAPPGAAAAGSAPAAQAQPPVEPPPAHVTARDLVDSIEPTIDIIERENHRVEEFRAGGNVYMVKVTPKNAPSYYLIDEDGSGNLVWRRGMDLERTVVPSWAIIRW